MQPYTDVLFSSSGPVPNVSVTVKTYPAGVVATLYSDNGSTTRVNPVITGNDGRFLFYAADGYYTLTVSATNILPVTIGPILLQDYAAKTVWVEQFNAVGDGSTDDRAAIQAAHDAVYNAGGGNVNFRGVTYKIGSPGLTLKQGVRFVGRSMWSTTIKGTFAGTLIQFTTSSAGEILTGVWVENLTVDGGAAGNGGTGILHLTPITGGASSRQCGLRNVRTTNLATGLALRTTQDFEAENCKFIACTTGVNASTDEFVTGTPQLCRFTSCDFRSNAKGIAGTYTAGSKPYMFHFDNCHFEVNTTHGIDASAISGIGWSFDSCKFEQNGTNAIDLTGCEAFTFKTCYFNNNSNTTNTEQIRAVNAAPNSGGGHKFDNCLWGQAASAKDFRFDFVPRVEVNGGQLSANGVSLTQSDVFYKNQYRSLPQNPAQIVQRTLAHWVSWSAAGSVTDVGILPNSSASFGANGVLYIDSVTIHVTDAFVRAGGTQTVIQTGVETSAQFISASQDVSTTGIKTPTMNTSGYAAAGAQYFRITLFTDGTLSAGKALVLINFREVPLKP